jgi:Protein of unknown function (DUF3768)
MQEDILVGLPRPGGMVEDDPLLTLLREGARQMLTHAIEAEVAAFLALHADEVDEEGRRHLVRHGHAPKRALQTGIGPIEIRRPRVRDRGANDESNRIRFTSAVLPAYLRLVDACSTARRYAKIDYCDASTEFGSEDQADLSKTTRVLTIMLAEDWRGGLLLADFRGVFSKTTRSFFF